jgi:hypothetical protein
MKQRVFSHVRARLAFVIGAIAVSTWVALQRPAPAPHSRAGLAELLGAASHARVDEGQLHWAPSRGVFLDLLWGRDVYFVARVDAAQLRDVYCARVRVSPSGQPLTVAGVHDLTQSPLADDTGLQGVDGDVAFATLADGQIQAATVLHGAAHGAAHRWGHSAAIQRSDVVLERPTPSLTLTMAAGQLHLVTADDDVLRFDFAARTLSSERSHTDPGQQLEPIVESTVKLGTLQVRLVSFERSRLSWRLRAGEREPLVAGQRPAKYQLDAKEHAQVLVALSLGHATVGTDYGMAFQGSSSLPLRGDRATLLVPEQGALRVILPADPIELGASDAAVQLPLLLDRGRITEQAATRGSRMQRAGLCVLSGGRVVVALADNDSSDVLALALQMQGCTSALELDRGSHHAAFLQQRGGSEPPLAGYPTSVLFGLDLPQRPERLATLRFPADL